MKLNTITITIRDMETTIAFYRGLANMNVLRRFDPGTGEIALLAAEEGGAVLEFVQSTETEPVRATGLTLSFRTRSALEPIREKAIAMGYAPTAIISQPTRPACFTVSDPNGLRVEFSR